ncbi:hypothetical protein AJ79_04056 [Helicocarpus griseus UAMH5409]|uniref:Uncharacterized protein n=1 Tax=Helicocarpus griseus UAMH5409 TaxID=1447875 RepID=A0A2B7XW28_9EURO|nr:hypothetical protein AJ79_04056 [Helicocarpus griseus UAMH5409]
MELWRERGFVPDSDEDEDFESQGSNKLSEGVGEVAGQEQGPEVDILGDGRVVEDSHESQVDPKASRDVTPQTREAKELGEERDESERLVTNTAAEDEDNYENLGDQMEDADSHGKPEDQAEDAPESRIVHQDSVNVSENLETNNLNKEAVVSLEVPIDGNGHATENTNTRASPAGSPAVDGPESQIVRQASGNVPFEIDDLDEDPLQHDDGLSNHILRAGLSSATRANTTTFSDPILRVPSSRTDRSSSPDELQFEQHFPPRTPTKKPPRVNDPKEGDGNDSEESSLSPAQSNPPTPPSFRDAQPKRSLRERKLINLRPYQVELMKYQRLCQSHNVRPVRVVIADRDSRQDESQGQESVDENAPPSSSPPASFRFPPVSSSVGPRRRRLAQSARPLDDSAQTANIRDGSFLLRDSPTHSRSKKCRKISHTYDLQDNKPRGNGENGIQVVVHNRELHSPLRESGGVFDVPLSSPSTEPKSLNHKLQRPARFRFPRGLSPSPIAASENERRSPRRPDPIAIDGSSDLNELGDHLEVESDPEPQSELLPTMEVAHGDVDGTDKPEETQDPEESEEGETAELRRLRRRIKGVLPASWPRLDLKQQQEREKAAAEKARLSYLRNRRQSGKGVAQRISRSTHEQRPRPNPFQILEDSSSESEPTTTAQRSREILSRLMDINDPLADGDDDIPEDNRIDYMLPPVPRKARQRNPHQFRVSATNREKRPRSRIFSRQRQRPEHQTRLTDTLKRPRATTAPSKPPLPRLGILDAADIQEPSQKQPHFLRVAARQARSRPGNGRKSPTRTYLRLETRQDTEDANQSLREWKAGTLRQSRITDNHARKRQRQSWRPENQTQEEEDDNIAAQIQQDDVPFIPRVIDLDATSVHNGQARLPSESHLVAQEASVKSSRAPRPKGRSGQQWTVRKGGYAITSLRRNAPRPAQLDISEPSTRTVGRATNFQRSLSALNSLYKASPLERESGLPMARFLAENALPQINNASPPSEEPNDRDKLGLSPEQRQAQRRQRKKRPPRHVNVETIEHQQLGVDMDIMETGSVRSVEAIERQTLRGLRPSGAVYTTDFGVVPLHLGTFFHASTFIGSGDFSRSMRLLSRNFDHDTGHAIIQYAGQTYQWGAWTETVSSELSALLDVIIQVADIYKPDDGTIAPDAVTKPGQALDAFRSIINYVNDKLSFMDPVDWSKCVDRCLFLLSKISDMLQLSGIDKPSTVAQLRVRFDMFAYVFANQLRQIASHGLVQSTKYFEVVGIMTTCQIRILQAVLSEAGLADIRRFLDEIKWREKRETGVKDDHPYLEAFLVVQKIFYTDPMLCGTNEDLLSQALPSSLLSNDARGLEKLWHGIFTTLPLYEFDELGIFTPGRRFKEHFDQWQTIKRLLEPVFEYEPPSNSSTAFNNYCRTLFHRCFYLIDSWGWRQSKIILDTLFDFFAKKKLHNLTQEQCYGSPSFLDELDRHPVLEMEPRDSCFHILLKIIGLGLRKMTAIYDKKKIRNFAYRLLPNHGREYPKEQPLRLEDLDALRNHHDLLCTLYWATPDACRPRVEIIRDLVHPARSHKEVCSINIHSWLRLVRFKLSTDEDTPGLIAFADWHSSFVLDMLQEHAHARTDIENQVGPNSFFSHRTVDKAVIDYQKPIESLLGNALVNLRMAIDATKTPDQALVLVDKLPLAKILELFNPPTARLQPLICKALDIVLAYSNTITKVRPSTSSAETNEDSQEFEGWTVFAELCGEEGMSKANPPVEHLNNMIRPTLLRFLSTCYGEDQTPDDIILLKVADSWASIAYTLASNGLREWSSYLHQYSEDSWASLRATDQTRKYLPYFLTKLIEMDGAFYTECKQPIITNWIKCIVERGSMLKYQHLLTSAVMNVDGADALLENLPFSKNPSTGRYEISLQEFSQRRLSLISCVLSNMREHISEDLSSRAVQSTRGQYRGLIEALMGAMKSNYEELGKVDSAHSSYLDFIHRVVSFLQQHSQKICPIDPFFTNPNTFPLPTDDPTYIVGKLKGYAVRLTSSKVANELFTFLQLVSERAAVDGQQTYLVDQLYSAMAETTEPGERHQSNIRFFLVHCIIPAYVEICLIAPGAWILVRPLLQSLTRILMDSIQFINACDVHNISSFVGAMICYFEAVDNALRLLVDHPGLLDEPHIVLTVTSLLETIITCLPTIDYLDRLFDQAAHLVAYVHVFKQFMLFAASTLLNPAAAVAPQTLDLVITSGNYPQEPINYPLPPQFFIDARNFAARGLQSRFQDGWSFYNGKYFVRPEHSQQVKEVVIEEPAGTSIDLAKEAFIRTVEMFFGTMEGLERFSSDSAFDFC